MQITLPTACSLVLLTGLLLAAEPVDPMEARIEFLKSRLARDPADYRTPVTLGLALLESARMNGNAARTAEARLQFDAALKIRAAYPPALLGAASAAAAQHRFADALKFAEDALAQEPANPLALGLKGDALYSIGDVANAELLYKRLGEKESGVFYQSRRANLCFIHGDLEGAQAALQAALESVPANLPAEAAVCRLKLGAHFFGLGKLDVAEGHYLAAKELLPRAPVILEYLAELRGAQGRFADAHELFDQILKTSASPHVFQSVGDLYALQKNKDEAAAWHRKALESCLEAVARGDFHPLRQLSMLYADVENNGSEAVKWARKDLELRQDVFALDTLAWAQYRAGDFTAALESIRKALARGTKDAHLFYHAGMIHSRTGDFVKGREYLEAARALNPYFQMFHAHR